LLLITYNEPKCVGISACKLGGDPSMLKKLGILENAKMAFGLIQILWHDLNVGLPYVLIFLEMSSFSRLKFPSGRNL
jgi:hypothetical protein